MLKKTVTYETFDGETVTEDFYFNISESELSDMEYSRSGGMSNFLSKIYKTKDETKMYEMFKDFILKAYGVKSPDGKKFYKNDDIRTDFLSSAAYPVIFSELVSNEKAASDFIIGVMPKKLAKDLPANPSDAIKMIEQSKK